MSDKRQHEKEIQEEELEELLEGEEFDELLRYTVPGYVLSLVVGWFFDVQGMERSAVGQWIVRTLAGEGESIFEGLFALKKRLQQQAFSMAQAYGWGKAIGMVVPWIIDWGSRAAGIDVYGVEGFYIPFFYAMSDQLGANIAGFVYLRRRTGSTRETLSTYFTHPVMLSSLLVILLVPVGLLGARLLGFSPTTQVYTALETIAANLCWVPPLVGMLVERRAQRQNP
ncbi:hypothetical protein [Rhodothermus marinus]|jgi:hypothetical protein|uniref:hypothetical protein n=1 Tax=Rhodothermus marinus TaxID=29549 RepID=UPI0012BA43A2|nr:hypothetical protein [Rhodothermus marinus]BBM71632.1 hypothetical protein RmaAA338_04970 [Rhodothermus marinus]